jgi:CheY-like chemotaxis protein
MTYEVLVVDNDTGYAIECARLVSLRTKLQTTSTDDPYEAINIVKSNAIKVVILDQKMPKRDGTDLFKDLIRIDGSIKAIMLTAEANAKEVAEAYRIGFVNYVEKSNVDSLSAHVLQQYSAYLTDIEEKSQPTSAPLYKIINGLFWFRHTISYHLVSVSVINSEYILPDSWRTVTKINAGEQTTSVITKQIGTKIVIEKEEINKLYSVINAKTQIKFVPEFVAKIEETIENKFKSTQSYEQSTIESFEKVYKLPDEPIDPNQNHVKSRLYEQAALYQQIRLIIKKTCSYCNSNEVFTIIINKPTSKIATRQIDHMSNGEVKTRETGIIN